jgi:hypothetical protein
MSHDDWMRWIVAGAGFLGIGLGVMLVGLVTRTGDLVTLGGVLAGVQALFLVALTVICHFSEPR